MVVYVLATLDTKGPEAEFVCRQLNYWGIATKLVDTGCLGGPTVQADITREQVFAAAGTSLNAMQQGGDRGEAVAQAALGATNLLLLARSEAGADLPAGILALGGSAGTTIGTAAMQRFEIGFPKVMVSTLASGQTRPYVGHKDIVMVNSVVDIAGLNQISRKVLHQAAAAMAGMVQFRSADLPEQQHRPLVVASMFGVTTPCVQRAREVLEAQGCEVLVFHATGVGGEAMEALIRDERVDGVLDITTTELADELVGGMLSAGPRRLTAAGERGVPQVVSVGALDMVNFGPPESVPEKFQHRWFHRHNANVTLMRTTPEENQQLGHEIGRKLIQAKGPVAVLLPRQGVSALDRTGQPFDDPAARAALFAAITGYRQQYAVKELDYHINDPEFAEVAAHKLLELMHSSHHPPHEPPATAASVHISD